MRDNGPSAQSVVSTTPTVSTVPSVRSIKRSRTIGRFLSILYIPLAVGWIVGQIVRDRYAIWEILFHIPAPVVGVTGGILVVASLTLRLPHRALAVAVFVVWPMIVTVCRDNHWRIPNRDSTLAVDSRLESTEKSAFRVAHWNVAYGAYGWDSAMATLVAQDARILVLSEPPSDITVQPNPWFGALQRQLAKSGWRSVYRNSTATLALFSDSPILEFRPLEIPGGGEAVVASIERDDGALNLLLIDLPSRIGRHRDPSLAHVESLIAKHHPDLVIGDFNAVRQATRLQHLPEGYRHAYDEAGSGWSYTWPVPIPVLAIDQILVGPRLEARDYLLVSGTSDHRLQRIDFVRKDPGTGISAGVTPP